MNAQQREEWLEEFQAWRDSPMTQAFFASLKLEEERIRSQWVETLWTSEMDPPVDQLRQLRMQASTLTDVINRKGPDVLNTLYPEPRSLSEDGGAESGA